MGAMITDSVFNQVAFFAQDVHELCYGIDHFLKDVIIIPPGKWRTDLILEPNDKVNEVSVRLCWLGSGSTSAWIAVGWGFDSLSGSTLLHWCPALGAHIV